MEEARKALRAGSLVLGALGLGACVGKVPLERGVLAYDQSTADTLSKQLLLNIARARQDLPIHFTAVTSIAATYKVSFGGGFAPAAAGDKGFLPVPFISAGSEENPTLSISPMQGEEFTERLLTPLSEAKAIDLLAQGYDVDALLRLIGAEVRLTSPDGSGPVEVCANRPSNRRGYEAFRRVVSHLSWIQDQHALRVEPLVLRYEWSIPVESLPPEAYQSLQANFALTLDPASHSYRVTRRQVGRLIVANYDPATLSAEDVVRLNAEAEIGPANEFLIDIRPGHPGGEFAIHGQLRLRSFHEVLSFIGRGMDEEPEYDVTPDPRTPAISENPVHALDVMEVDRPPKQGLFVSLNGRHYALRPETGYQWNRKVFSLLYQVFQMTVSAPVASGPAIAIAK